MITKRLTKADIALSQINVALSFYLRGRELVSAITLAGAAEEILGKLCERAGFQSSLTRKTESCRALCMQLWKNDPGTKPFADLKNKTRNELKHLISGAPIEPDLEGEAARILTRAVENYCNLFGMETPKMREFQRKRLRPYRTRGV